MENRKNKHLTLEDRNTIQQCLDHGMTFKAIAAKIGKDQTTIKRGKKASGVYGQQSCLSR